MKFKKGFLVHDRFLDIAFEVLEVIGEGKIAILKVFTWNRGWTGNPWLVGKQPSRIVIDSEDFDSWHYMGTLERHPA